MFHSLIRLRLTRESTSREALSTATTLIKTRARNCLEQHGTGPIYRETNGNTFHFLCQSDSGQWFDVVTEKEDDTHFTETSAYSPKGGIWEDILKWLGKVPRVASEFTEIPKETPVTITQ